MLSRNVKNVSELRTKFDLLFFKYSNISFWVKIDGISLNNFCHFFNSFIEKSLLIYFIIELILSCFLIFGLNKSNNFKHFGCVLSL